MPTQDPNFNIHHPEGAAFWDARYGERPGLFGAAPNAFVAAQAHHMGEGAEVVELGAGAGRNLFFLAETHSARVTAVDFAAEGLEAAQRQAEDRSVALETIRADLRTWQPGRRWDAAIVTFVQLLPGERPAFYRLLQDILRPGGILAAQWFRPAHGGSKFADIGPPPADERFVSTDELRAHFPTESILHLEKADVTLDEGPVLQGRAAVVEFIFQYAT